MRGRNDLFIRVSLHLRSISTIDFDINFRHCDLKREFFETKYTYLIKPSNYGNVFTEPVNFHCCSVIKFHFIISFSLFNSSI